VEEGTDRWVPPIRGKGKKKRKRKVRKGGCGLSRLDWAAAALLGPGVGPVGLHFFFKTFSFFYFLILLYLLQNSFKSTQTKS
jgi:hypothetical protein